MSFPPQKIITEASSKFYLQLEFDFKEKQFLIFTDQ